jgi:hypothetical protein
MALKRCAFVRVNLGVPPRARRPSNRETMKAIETNEMLPRVESWRSDIEIDPTDFTYGVFQAAIERNATEILLTPTLGEGVVRVDFKIDGTYFKQPAISRVQFGFIAIHLAHIANRAGSGKTHGTEKLFESKDGKKYRLRFWKVQLANKLAAVTLHIDPV